MKLIKKHKWTLLVSSIVILLPIIFGVVSWNKLPAQMATHWGVGGETDGWTPRALAVFLLPCLLLAVHWICVLISVLDKGSAKQTDKAFKIVLWIIPVLSVYVNAIMYATAFGMKLNMNILITVLLGAGLSIIGNYLPKFSRNRTMGIKIYWTLRNDENWNATHRFAGKLWVAGGIVLLLAAFVPSVAIPYIAIAVMLCMVIIPIIYSYAFYRKQLQSKKATKEDYKSGK